MLNIEEILIKVKLIEKISVIVPLNINEINKKLDNIICEDNYNWFGNYSESKFKYRGMVDNEGFILKNKLQELNKGRVCCAAYGSFSEQNDNTKIEIKIIGYDTFMKIYFSFLMFFYLIIFYSILASNNSIDNHNSKYALTANLIMIIILTIFPYFNMRRGIEKFKYFLEIELMNLAKN